MTTPCPECQSPLTLPAEPTLNEIVECLDCRAELEVVATSPLLLALAPEIEEDWGE
ncbi:MAG TPA: lysine biosynthesis protein LysW [Jatrophihabitans sp.]|uniref:lysine biosynthesis protein LysW n=1 Tax=Jatrophihabitans sp. TaxID=1932789 RepID=UPI002F18951A